MVNFCWTDHILKITPVPWTCYAHMDRKIEQKIHKCSQYHNQSYRVEGWGW